MTVTATREHLLYAGEVVDATGITYRQLLYWVEKGYITPAVRASGSGNYYRFSPSVVDEIEDLLARIDACPFDHHGRRRP